MLPRYIENSDTNEKKLVSMMEREYPEGNIIKDVGVWKYSEAVLDLGSVQWGT